MSSGPKSLQHGVFCLFNVFNEVGNISEQNKVIRKIPATNRRIFQILLSFLHHVSTKSYTNRMNLAEIGTVFGPVVFRHVVALQQILISKVWMKILHFARWKVCCVCKN